MSMKEEESSFAESFKMKSKFNLNRKQIKDGFNLESSPPHPLTYDCRSPERKRLSEDAILSRGEEGSLKKRRRSYSRAAACK